MSPWGVRQGLLVVAILALAFTGAAAAADGGEARGIDPNQGDSLVEITLPDKAAAIRLQLESESYGVEFNDHYLRHNANDTVTATVFASEDELEALQDAGYELGATIEGPDTWRARIAEREATVAAEERAADAASGQTFGAMSHSNELVVLRVDYFENYDGRFLSVEAKTRLGGGQADGTGYEGPTLSLSWNTGEGTAIDAGPRVMNINLDTDTTPDTYIEHRELVRIGEYGSTTPGSPTMVRIGSSTGQSTDAPVQIWLGGGLPPMADGFLKDFTTHYMDPTEVYDHFRDLAAEFPNISELITLPHKTNGYQRRAQATMAGTTGSGSTVPGSLQAGAVVLTSRAWGHEGGNDITAEFRNPSASNAALTVSVTGKDILVSLATNETGVLTSTATQVIDAINGHAGASALVVARTYRGNSGLGVVLARSKVNLSDFLTEVSDNSHVQRGPFEYFVMRIGKHRTGNKVGVFLYCQQHAREWATPLTCLETAEQLLRNYALDKRTRQLVDGLDIFILPSSNPDGSHYSIHNFTQQRRNMTNHCVVGGKESDDPFASDFWTPRTRPDTNAAYTNTDPASRDLWGVDPNRNNTVGTLFDGYIGASYSCTSDTYTGPGEASEPEIQNELWVADTFKNIKFSNNIHSFGGYFMWAPGAYLPNRDEGDLVHANIGVEKYFFEAGDRILNRIKEHRGTAILPERTGPIADVLYSAGGNSADEHWYNRGVIAYSFETGADRFVDTTLQVASEPGATGVRLTNRNGFQPGDRIIIDAGTANAETRVVATVAASNPPSPAANVTLTSALSLAHAVNAVVDGGIAQQSVGFQPDYDTEGKHEALEFAAGNYGLLESALEYAQDETAPVVTMSGPTKSNGPVTTTFVWVNEPSVIRYTTDGSRPNESSPLWDSTGPREPGEVFHLTQSTTFRWIATDIKGNTSMGSQRFTIRR